MVQLGASRGSDFSNLLFTLTPRWRGREEGDQLSVTRFIKVLGPGWVGPETGCSGLGGYVSEQDMVFLHLQTAGFCWDHSYISFSSAINVLI